MDKISIHDAKSLCESGLMSQKELSVLMQMSGSVMEEVPNQDSFNHGKVLKKVKSTLVNRKKGNMPQEFGKIRPERIVHSPTMTP